MSAETVTIDRLGGRGDGIAETDHGSVHVPFTLPGETVAIARRNARGTLIALKAAAPERVEPPCPHFGPDGAGGACGGCGLQHMDTNAYRHWKRNLLVKALAARGIEVDVAPLLACPPGARRRLALTARRTRAGLLIGFLQAASHHIVNLDTCHVAVPAIVDQFTAIRRVAAALACDTKPFRLTVLAAETGLDIAATQLAGLTDRKRLGGADAALAEAALARLSANGEILVEKRPPILSIGAARVTPPPGGFVQAVAEAEVHMARLVADHFAAGRRIADLFSGLGTFALRLASHVNITAVEADADALAALERGHRHAAGVKSLKTERRDLFRRPLMAAELKTFDGVVFDPPRAGAEAQCRELAASQVPRLAAVSCNPVTLARDLAILTDGGYSIDAVHPVDQFLWSPHVEAVALLRRE